ncbi:MAG TPA: DoxX family protein [Bryobacteraceae bacterium]|nr:DoxX family protein [Bryobacteraceae bacterium]
MARRKVSCERVIVLAVLLSSWLVLRAIGAAGVQRLASWRDSGRWALAMMLLFTASAHFTSMRHDLARMVPEWVPSPGAVIFVTGILEIAGAVGILLPRTRGVAGICLCLLFAVMFAANVKAAREGLRLGGSPATPLVLRLPMQVLFIWLAWWSTRTGAGRESVS